jgi:uncharacterized protein
MPGTATKPAREKVKLEQITAFLAHRRFALVGVSRNPRDMTRMLMRDLAPLGYEVVPVSPNLDEVEGRKCFARVQQIQPPVEAAMLFVAPEITEQVLHECAAAGIKRVWIRAGQERLTPVAIAYGREAGMDVIVGECPYMFLPNAGWVHRFHGFVSKLTGSYPR